MSKTGISRINNHQPFFTGLFAQQGRLCRRYFCYYLLLYIVLSLAVSMIGQLLGVLVQSMGMLIALMLYLPLVGGMLCQIVRRYHDFGVSGWLPGGFFVLTLLFGLLRSVPGSPLYVDPSAAGVEAPGVEVAGVVISFLGLLVFVFIPALVPGRRGFNRYGSDPLRPFVEQLDEMDKCL